MQKLFAVLFFLAACGNADGSGSPKTTTTTTTTTVPAAPVDMKAKALETFNQRCVTCHGNEGRGDGVAAVSLTPKPRNFHDQAWQAKVTDDHIMTTIKTGGAAVGLSPAMPSQPDLANNPDLLAALKDHIRELGKTP